MLLISTIAMLLFSKAGAFQRRPNKQIKKESENNKKEEKNLKRGKSRNEACLRKLRFQ